VRVERVGFQNTRGLNLVGNLYSAESRRIVILSHGYTSDKDSRGRFPRLAAALNAAGYNALAFDFAGCGESDDDTLHPDKLLEDLRSAIDFVQARGFDPPALYGHSLGSTLSLRAYRSGIPTMVLSGAGTGPMHYDWSRYYSLAQLRELAATRKLTTAAGGEIERTVVVDQAMLDSFANLDSRSLLTPVQCPVLLIHGDSQEDEEERLLLERSRQALQFLPANSRLEIIPGAGHSFDGHYDKVIDLTVDWLKSHL
jgi:pimeloyl-ACP methyl ester carboxylesterase